MILFFVFEFVYRNILMHEMKNNPFDKNYYFGKVYKDYDEFLDWPERAEDLLARFSCKSFLDVGCGCGNLVREIKQKAERKYQKSCDVQGIDFSEYAVNKANLPYVQLASCQQLPFSDQRFDTVYILTTLSYLPDDAEIKQAMQEAYRVAKGVIIFDDVYTVPEIGTDDYDPFRKHVFSQKEWMEKWQQLLADGDKIEVKGDEIIIKKRSRNGA